MKKTTGEETVLLPYLDEREQRINADHAWCVGEQEIRRKHGGKIAAVYNRTVLGVGRTYAAAWAAAQRRRAGPPKTKNRRPPIGAPYQGVVRVPTTTVFTPSLFPLPAPAVHHVSQSWWTCHSGASGRHRYRERFDTMLAPGLLLTVMPPTVTQPSSCKSWVSTIRCPRR